uniref:CCHC-type domain-containing protein n=1 Tax=Meloidogyne floridensis TaxID=298350 RepID=A0A915NF36_9BILA
MSAPCRDALRLLAEDATEILENKKEFKLPEQTGSISLHRANIRSLITSLELELGNVSETITDITSSHERWMTVRTSMTGAERQTDTPIYEKFITEIPFLNIVRDLKRYSRKLLSEKAKLAEALPDPSQITNTHFHLPKLSLPKFNGKCVEFTSFWNSFKVGVHDVPDLSDAVKFNYLKECLDGPALLLIKSLPLTNASYHEAIRLLRENYGNADEINRTLLHSIRKLPTVHSNNGPENFCMELRTFVDQFELLYLQMIEQEFDINTLSIQMELESKLPPPILEEIFKAKDNYGENWQTDQLRTTLKQILKRKEGIKALDDQKKELNEKISHSCIPKSPRPVRQISPPNTQQSSLTFTVSQQNNRTGRLKFPCIFCNQLDHLSHLCYNYNSIDSRKSRLYEKNFCFSCYKSNHISRNCQRPLRCTHCHNLHPRALCSKLFNPEINKPRIDQNCNEETNISPKEEITHQHTINHSQITSITPTPITPIPLSLIKLPDKFYTVKSLSNYSKTETELVYLNRIKDECKPLLPEEPQLTNNIIKSCTQKDSNQNQLPIPDPTTSIPANIINQKHGPMKASENKILEIKISVPTDNVRRWKGLTESSGPPGDVPSDKSPSPTPPATKLDSCDIPTSPPVATTNTNHKIFRLQSHNHMLLQE